MSFLRRLFGLGEERPREPAAASTWNRSEHDLALDAAVAEYFELAAEIDRQKSLGNYRAAIDAARASLPLLPKFVAATVRDARRFDIQRSEAVHTASRLMAVMQDAESLAKLRATLESTVHLAPWVDVVTEAEADLDLIGRILAVVRSQEGVLQKDLKGILGEPDGRRISTLLAAMERGQQLARLPRSGTHALYPPGSNAPDATTEAIDSSPVPPPMPRVSTARRWRPTRQARPIDLSTIPYVRLPMAPPSWEAHKATGQGDSGSSAHFDDDQSGQSTAYFSVEGNGWEVEQDERIPKGERPDPAFRDVFPTASTTYWLDPKGKRERYPHAASVLQSTDRDGKILAERGLSHDVYRSDVNPNGSGVLFLSRDGMLHGYNDALESLIVERVSELPEYGAQAARLGIAADELRLHVRCVALSADRQHYLVTVVDEAWLIAVATGDVVWGLRTPMQDGWTRRAQPRSARFGTSAEVDAALRLMELQLPITNDDVIRQYRVLASRWHPDRNPNDPHATARFQHLRSATELLTGTDLTGLSGSELEIVTYEKILSRSNVTIPVPGLDSATFTVSVFMTVTEKSACDWIYAANLGHDGRAFVACYSGKVIVVSPSGTPQRVYDIGAVPRHVEDVGDRLYILTDTRLYVLNGDRLEALIDVYDRGELLLAENGFALQDAKQLVWYSLAGERIGMVSSKAPIRRAYSTDQGLVVETRTRRLTVAGAPSWWR